MLTKREVTALPVNFRGVGTYQRPKSHDIKSNLGERKKSQIKNKMMSQAAYAAEQAVGHQKEEIKQDVSNYETLGDPNEKMKALVWQGKQKVEVGML